MYKVQSNDLKYATTLMKIHIDTNDHKPIALKPCRILLAHVKWIDRQITQLLKAGIIRHLTCPWKFTCCFGK